MALHQFSIDAKPGEAQVTVDGVPHEPTALHLDIAVENGVVMPRLTLEYAPGTEISGEGQVVHVIAPDEGEVLRVAAQWLRGLDPAEIRRVVESRVRTMRDDPIAHTLAVIAEAAEEAAGA